MQQPSAPQSDCCAVSGANGYVGSIVAKAIEKAGMRVLRLQRRVDDPLRQRSFSLSQPSAPEALRDVKALVHCAWDFSPSSWAQANAVNVEGSLQLFEAARAAGVARLVFVSSMSAFVGCRSLYGKAKLAVEESVASWGGVNVRPGLVYGSNAAGMIGSLAKLTRLPILPVITMGNRRLHLIHEEDLGRLVAEICAGVIPPPATPIVAAHPTGYTLVEILQQLAASRGRPKPLFVPIPWQLVWAALRACESLGLKARLRSDGLTGLLNLDADPDFRAASALPFQFRVFSPVDSPTQK